MTRKRLGEIALMVAIALWLALALTLGGMFWDMLVK